MQKHSSFTCVLIPGVKGWMGLLRASRPGKQLGRCRSILKITMSGTGMHKLVIVCGIGFGKRDLIKNS